MAMMDGRAVFYFLTRTGPVATQSCLVLRYAFCSSFDPRELEHSTHEMFTSTRGEWWWPMPPEDDTNANVAELFASRPLGVAELFADQIVQTRIGRLITEAMSKPTRLQRVQTVSLSLDRRSRASEFRFDSVTSICK